MKLRNLTDGMLCVLCINLLIHAYGLWERLAAMLMSLLWFTVLLSTILRKEDR